MRSRITSNQGAELPSRQDSDLFTACGHRAVWATWILGALASLLVAGCGYRAGGLYEVEEISIPMFDNQTERRLHEFDLTQAVVREASQRGIRVSPNASHELRGRIMDIDQPVVVPGPRDQVVAGAFSMKVEVWIVDRRNGKEMIREVVSQSATFDESRSRTVTDARQEVLDRLAKIIISKIEKNW